MSLKKEKEWKDWLFQIWSAKNGEFYIAGNTDEKANKELLIATLRNLYAQNATVEQALQAVEEIEENIYKKAKPLT
jgi:hypothetical protein